MADESIVYTEQSALDFEKANAEYFPYDEIKPSYDEEGKAQELSEESKRLNAYAKKDAERDAKESWERADNAIKDAYPESTVGARQAMYTAVQKRDMATLLSLVKHKELIGAPKSPESQPATEPNPDLDSLISRWQGEGMADETLKGLGAV